MRIIQPPIITPAQPVAAAQPLATAATGAAVCTPASFSRITSISRRMGGILATTAPALMGASCDASLTVRYAFGIGVALLLGGLTGWIYVRNRKVWHPDAYLAELRSTLRQENLQLALGLMTEEVADIKHLLMKDAHDSLRLIISRRLHNVYASAVADARRTCIEQCNAALERLGSTEEKPVDAMRECSNEIMEYTKDYWAARTKLQQELILMAADPDKAAEQELRRRWSIHDIAMQEQFNEILLRSKKRDPDDFS